MLLDYSTNGKRSEDAVERRVRKHLLPYFAGRRLATITTSDVRAYVARRQAATEFVRDAYDRRLPDGTTRRVPELRRPGRVSNAEINRELQHLKRIFSLANKAEKVLRCPHIPLLREAPPRAGFFEVEQFEAVCRHLPDPIRDVVTFAYITGWRVPSEVLTLEWPQVDLAAGTVVLHAGRTKNGEGRLFPMTADLRTLLETRRQAADALRDAGTLTPLVFFRMVAKGRRGPKAPKPITAFTKAWRTACAAAGCPGRIPHDFRRTAVRNLVRAGIPERVAMTMTGHKTRSVFERYNIVSEGDLLDAARKATAYAEAQRSARLGKDWENPAARAVARFDDRRIS
ncbi:MAG: tyrosine-type recombinase/integrase [Vicinamibacterales bacterium]